MECVFRKLDGNGSLFCLNNEAGKTHAIAVSRLLRMLSVQSEEHILARYS